MTRKTRRLGRAWNLAHQLHDVPLRVTEANHPQVVGLHARDKARRRFDLHAHVDKMLVRGVHIRDAEVENGALMIQLGCARGTEHQADTAAAEESHVACGKQQRQAQHVAVECRRAGQVVRDDGNLADAVDRKSTRLNSSHSQISYAVFCLKKKKKTSYYVGSS